MFTVIRAVLLKPLQFSAPDQLVRLESGATPTRFTEMRAATRSFTGLVAVTETESVTLAGGAEPEVLQSIYVSASFLPILGVAPIRGRGFRPEEDAPGGARVAMISAELWQRRFGGDPHIAGKTALLADAPYTIIGVLPPHFRFPFPGLDIWMTAPAEVPTIPAKARALSPFLTVFGRLKPGVTLEQANAELRVIRRQYAMAHPAMLDAKPKTPVELTAMKDDMVADVRTMLWMLFGAAGFVLMIACANVAGLLLARATSRAREFAVRAAVGAARARLIRQLLAESVLLSLIGGVFGVLLAAYILRAIPKMTAFAMPRAADVHLDGAVLAFAAVLSIATGVLFGLAPSLGASRPNLMAALRTSGAVSQAAVPRRILPGWSLRNLLLTGQVALSIVLMIGAVLLMESIARMRLWIWVSTLATCSRCAFLFLRCGTIRVRRTRRSFAISSRESSLPGVRVRHGLVFPSHDGFCRNSRTGCRKAAIEIERAPHHHHHDDHAGLFSHSQDSDSTWKGIYRTRHGGSASRGGDR